MATAIQIENISKLYRLGEFGTGTISHDINRWWYKIRGKEDPFRKIGQVNDRSQKGDGNYVWSLKDINLTIEQGDIVGIIGRNGAGKSTLLKILSGITAPTTGEIKLRGRMASLLEVGTGFHPEMTGLENIYMNGTIMGMTRHEINSRLEEIVEFAGVAKYLDTPVKRYSSGMMVRLGFAIAAHLESEILVVDEVLAVGDAEFQKKAIGKMQEVSSSGGKTVLFVSHNMGAVKNLCTKAIVLDKGQLCYTGQVKDGIAEYLNLNTKKIAEELNTRRDRKGNGVLRFEKITLRSSDKVSIQSLASGQYAEFVLEVKLNRLLQNVIIRMIIVDSNDQVMFVCNNFHSSTAFTSLAEGQQIVCTIESLPLPQGSYYVHLQALENKEVLDEIDFAGEIDVESGDFYGTGKVPAIKGGLYVHHSYYLENGQ